MKQIAVLAEISDKVPTVAETTLIGIAIACLAGAAAASRRWELAVVTILVLLACNAGLAFELRDPGFADALWSELGASYVYGQFAAINGPSIVVVTAVVVRRWHRTRTVTR